MLEVIFSPNFFNAAHQLVNEIVRVSVVFLTLAVIVYFISMLMRLSAGREGDNLHYHIFFVVFSAIGLVTYPIWAVWLGKLFVMLSRSIFDLDSGNIMSDYLGNFFASAEGSSFQISVYNILSLEALSSLSYMLVMMIYEIFVIIQVIVQIFFYLLGPLAIVISMFPNFRDVFRIWLANFCAVNFWSVLAAILFRLVRVLTTSDAFQLAMQNEDKTVLWDSFMLGVIISVALILIPKFSSGIFGRAGASADLGTYGIGITAGVLLSTVWNRLKFMTMATTSSVTAGTAATVVGGARAMTASPVDASNQSAAGALNGGAPFSGVTQATSSVGDLQG